MNGAGAATGPLKIPTARIVWALVTAAFVLTPIGAVAHQLFWLRSWHGDIPAVVDHVSGSRVSAPRVDDHYSVEFAGALPEDASDSDLSDGEPVSEMLEGVEVGDPVTCHVEQTFIGSRDVVSGPRTTITHCWR